MKKITDDMLREVAENFTGLANIKTIPEILGFFAFRGVNITRGYFQQQVKPRLWAIDPGGHC